MTDMTPDLNWLLSTVAQSAAALVAIIAGFIASRLLALSAERSGLQSRLRDLNLQLEAKRNELQPIRQRLLDVDAEDFIEDLLDDIVKSKARIELQDVIGKTNLRGFTADDFRPYWDKAISVTTQAFALLEKRSLQGHTSAEGVEDALNEANIDSESSETIFWRVAKYLDEERSRAKLETLNKMFSAGTPYPGAMMPEIEALRINPKILQVNEYNQWKRDAERLKWGIEALESSRIDLVSQIRNSPKPKGLKLALLTLTYFSFAGIVIPLILLATRPAQHPRVQAWGTIALFISGLVLFFVSLLNVIRQTSL
jgi:hypothetical protein